jgi:hypothetical protein
MTSMGLLEILKEMKYPSRPCPCSFLGRLLPGYGLERFSLKQQVVLFPVSIGGHLSTKMDWQELVATTHPVLSSIVGYS